MKINEISENQIFDEYKDLNDTRLRNKIYPLTLMDEAKWVNNTPALKESLYAKQLKLLQLAKRQTKVVKEVFIDTKTCVSSDEYVILSILLIEFHPDVEKLASYVNRLISISGLLSLAENILAGKNSRFREIDIEEQRKKVLQAAVALGIPLKKMGSIYKCLCPFHEERTASFTLYPESYQFTCFGCGESVDTIGLVMKIKGCSFVEALTFLERL